MSNEAKSNIEKQVHRYSQFMGIETFPEYSLQYKSVSLETAQLRGYESLATTLYEPNAGKHTIILARNLMVEDDILFHEFTHMLDAEQYANCDKMRWAWLSGYTEYHASQVELMYLLGANKVTDKLSFSMNLNIRTSSGEKSVSDYINSRYQHAIEMFSRSDFPADLGALKSTLGILFNYYGLISICQMYSTDFVEPINDKILYKFIPYEVLCVLNSIMRGWIDNSNIELSMQIYKCIVLNLVQKYKLQ